MKTYKAIVGPAPGQVISEKGTNDEAVARFDAVLANMAREGWAYHSMEPITTYQTKGCISKTTTSSTFYMMIFEKDI